MSTLAELIKNKRQEIVNRTDRRQATKLPMGKSKWRILPNWLGDAEGVFWHDFGQHFVKDRNGAVQAVFTCPDKTMGLPCDVCSAQAAALEHVSYDEALEKIVKDAKGAQKHIVNAVKVDVAADKQEVTQLELGQLLFKDILGIMMEYGNIVDPDQGTDLVIERTGSGQQTKYTVMPAPKSQPINPKFLQGMVNLDEWVDQGTEQARNKAIAGLADLAGQPTLINARVSAPSQPRAAALIESRATTVAAAAAEVSPIAGVTLAGPGEAAQELEAKVLAEIEAAPAPAPKAGVTSVAVNLNEVAPVGDDLDAILAEIE